MKTYLVPFLTGDGTGETMLTVTYIAEFPRDTNGLCAFCHGDPCAEESSAVSLISKYFARNKHAATCPCCDGRPS